MGGSGQVSDSVLSDTVTERNGLAPKLGSHQPGWGAWLAKRTPRKPSGIAMISAAPSEDVLTGDCTTNFGYGSRIGRRSAQQEPQRLCRRLRLRRTSCLRTVQAFRAMHLLLAEIDPC
jgi:hypothetical protein